jgi:cyclopropane fatty-acyl-phospholipid synthase-like methyltransferase
MEASAKNSEQDGAEKLPFKKRLKAWWDGYEFFDNNSKAVPFDLNEEEEEEPDLLSWGARRQLALATLFGPSMSRCIPESARVRITRPMGVNKKMSVTEIGSGLGGFSRWVAEDYEAYVTSYEPNEDLLDACNEMLKMAGMFRFVKTLHCDYEDFQPKDRSADAAFASEAFLTVEDKETLFRRIKNMMKPEGQFMMSDYMIDGVDSNNPDLQKWMQKEPIQPHILDVQKTREFLTRAGFEVSIAEDTTNDHKAAVLKAFADYADKTSRSDADEKLHAWVLKEGELWTNRVQAMEAGVLKVYRIYARVPLEIE